MRYVWHGVRFCCAGWGAYPMVFWWTGRGFLALASLIGVFAVFGAVLTLAFGDQLFERAPWLWGVGMLIAAVTNWVVGCRVNRRALLPGKSWSGKAIRIWLTRPARHRFLSLAFELWSLPAVVLAVFLFLRGLLSR